MALSLKTATSRRGRKKQTEYCIQIGDFQVRATQLRGVGPENTLYVSRYLTTVTYSDLASVITYIYGYKNIAEAMIGILEDILEAHTSPIAYLQRQLQAPGCPHKARAYVQIDYIESRYSVIRYARSCGGFLKKAVNYENPDKWNAIKEEIKSLFDYDMQPSVWVPSGSRSHLTPGVCFSEKESMMTSVETWTIPEFVKYDVLSASDLFAGCEHVYDQVCNRLLETGIPLYAWVVPLSQLRKILVELRCENAATVLGRINAICKLFSDLGRSGFDISNICVDFAR